MKPHIPIHRFLVLSAFALLSLAPPTARAASGTWTQAASGGNWSDTANWSGGIVADASGSTAAFNTLDLTANNSVHLDGSHTLTGLTFGDTDASTAFSWILDDNTSSGGNILTLAGTTPTITVSAMGTGSSATISAVIGGSTAWSKAGAGTLVLSGANTTSGAATLTGGTLALSGGDNRLLSTSTFTFNGNNTILDLGSNSQTLAKLTVSSLAQTDTIQGGGSLILSGANDFRLGPTSTALTQALNLAAVTNFTYNASSNFFDVGPQSGSTTGTYTTTLTLAANNSITAGQFGVGDVSPNSGGSNNPSTVNLGQTNAINASTINVGVGGRNGGNLLFTSGLTSPSLTIRATNGTGRANWTVGTNGANRADSQLKIHTVDLVTGVAGTSLLDAQVGTLTLGYGTRTNNAQAGVTGIFTMGGGTLDATTIILGQDTAGGSSDTCTGTLSLNGGTVKVTTLTIGNRLGGNTVVGNFNLNSGTLRATTIKPGSGSATRNLSWTTGSIQNYDASTDLTINSGVTLSLIAGSDHTFNIDASRNASVGSVVSNSGNLVKSGDGTLVLTAVNTYIGTTTVSGGALLVNSPGSTHASSAVTVQSGGTLGGTGTINGTVTVNAGGTLQPTPTGTAGTLSLSNATAPSFASSSILKVRVPTTSTADKVSLSHATPVFSCSNVDLVIDTTGLGGAAVTGELIVQTANASGISGTFHSVTANDGYTPTVHYNANSITVDLTVTSAQTSTFALTDFSGTQTAGTAGTITVTAQNFYGVTATGYIGTIHFTSTDGAAVLPTNYTFQPSDNGVHTFTNGVTLNTQGTQSISVADSGTGSISGTQSGIIVAAGASAATLTVAGLPTSQVAGTPGSVTVTAKTASGSTATNYTGTVRFTSSDGAAALPTSYTFQPSDNGTHTFASAVTLKTVGTQSFTATDTVTSYITGTQSGVSVTPATAATLTLTGFPSLEWTGVAASETVTVRDAYGNLATNYTGTIQFTSTDGAAVLPADYTFSGGDGGLHTFTKGVTFNIDGSQSITATDAAASIGGTQSGITIASAATFTWNSLLSGAWSNAAKWTNEAGVAMPPATTGLAKYTLNFNLAGTYTATQDLADGFILNRLNFGGSAVTLGGYGLALASNGATPPQINQSAAVTSTVGNNIVLNADTTVDAIGGVTLNGVISGAGGLTKTGVGTLTMGNTANNYNGPTVISGGRFSSNISGNGGFGTGGSITIASNAILDLNGPSTIVTNSGIFNGTTINAGNGFGEAWSGTVTLSGDTTVNVGYGMAFTNIVSGTGGLIKTGGGTMSLNNANTFSGTMAVNVGTLKLGASGSINDATNLTLAANTTFDVSSISSYILSSNTSLSASGAANAATIKGAVGGAVSLGAQPLNLSFTPTSFTGDVARPALKVSQGALILDNNPLTVKNAAATALGTGVYRLIQVGDGSTGTITENVTPSYPVTVTGTGLATGTAATISVSSGNVILTVVNTDPYLAWATAHELTVANSAADADPDNDGLVNALEFVLGGEPNPARPNADSVGLLPKSTRNLAGDLLFTFPRAKASEGAATVTFQWSTDLSFPSANDVPVLANSSSADANGVTVDVTPGSLGTDSDTVVITVPVANARAGRVFGRLLVTVP